MQCPKCGLVQGDAPECQGCGIIIAKFKPRSLLPETPPPTDTITFLTVLLAHLSAALDKIRGVNWMPLIGMFGVGWAIWRMDECHKEVREPFWIYLISLAAFVALFVTLMHHWIMMEEAKQNKHWNSPIWNAEARWDFSQWAQWKSSDKLTDMAETIHGILADRQQRGISL